MFVSIRDVLRYCNDTDTIALRLFGGIGCIRLESHEYANVSSRFTRIYSEILHESVRKYESCTIKREFVTVLDNS